MSLWELAGDAFRELERTDFGSEGVRERQDLQAVLRDNVKALAPGVLVIAEEFSDWEDSNLRIDLLGIDKDANLVVIELKRTGSGGHSDLQAIRYASMVSSMTFAQATSAFRSYLDRRGRDGEVAEATLLEFLGWDEPNEEQFALDVRIVLASADFSKPLTSAVLWLRDRGVDIRCVRMRPHRLAPDDDRLLLDIQQIVPLPEASEIQVRLAQKAQKQRTERAASRDMRRFDIQVQSHQHENLPKNRAALAVVRALVDELETPPERILEETSEGRRRKSMPLLRGFDDRLSGVEVEERLRDIAPSMPGRYFTADEDLFFVGDRTWAFTTQWSGRHVEEFIAELASAFPDLDVEYQIAGSD